MHLSIFVEFVSSQFDAAVAEGGSTDGSISKDQFEALAAEFASSAAADAPAAASPAAVAPASSGKEDGEVSGVPADAITAERLDTGDNGGDGGDDDANQPQPKIMGIEEQETQEARSRVRRTSAAGTEEEQDMTNYMMTRGRGGRRRSSAVGTEDDAAMAAGINAGDRRASQGGPRRPSAIGTEDDAAMAAAAAAAAATITASTAAAAAADESGAGADAGADIQAALSSTQ